MSGSQANLGERDYRQTLGSLCEDPGVRRNLSVLQTQYKGEDTRAEFGNRCR